MFVLNQVMVSSLIVVQARRIGVEEALKHPYLDEGRLRFHSCMCRCCRTSSSGLRIYAADLEPCTEQHFDDRWEKKVMSLQQIKEELYRLVSEHAQSNRTPLCINPHSAAFKSFTRYTTNLTRSNHTPVLIQHTFQGNLNR